MYASVGRLDDVQNPRSSARPNRDPHPQRPRDVRLVVAQRFDEALTGAEHHGRVLERE